MRAINQFLRSIGFAGRPVLENDLEILLDNIAHSGEGRKTVHNPEKNTVFLEASGTFGPNIGLRVVGELDGRGFHRQGYFPYLESSNISSEASVNVDRRWDGCSFAGMADDPRAGISLIYYVQNPADLCRETNMLTGPERTVTTTLTGLASNGMILLPMKGNHPESGDDRAAFYKRYDKLMKAAKNGSQEAIESLTMEDMDIYAMISRRIQYEDVLSIVDSYLMPYSMECDQYQILGTILFYQKIKNSVTEQDLWLLTLSVNDITMDVCINSEDLMGEPLEGRRFKGNIWMQGKLNF